MIYRKVLFLFILLQCILTIIHHLYGEFFLYQDGIRLHIVLFAPLALLLTFAPLKLHRNPFGWRMFIGWTLFIWVLVLGMFEGLWNHVVVDVIAQTNFKDRFDAAFIRSTPGDFIFEFTGIFQFVLACIIAFFLVRAYQPGLLLYSSSLRVDST